MTYRYRLYDLNPRFLQYVDDNVRRYCDDIAQAQGIFFLCPVCFEKNCGAKGTHGVVCWSSSAGVPDSARPAPGRWRLVGRGFHDLSLMEEPGKSRSVLLIGGCNAHFFVTNGEVHP